MERGLVLTCYKNTVHQQSQHWSLEPDVNQRSMDLQSRWRLHFTYQHIMLPACNDVCFFYRGVWNVPFITNCYLMKMSLFRVPAAKEVTYTTEGVDADMAFCASLRERVSDAICSIIDTSQRYTVEAIWQQSLNYLISVRSSCCSHIYIFTLFFHNSQ